MIAAIYLNLKQTIAHVVMQHYTHDFQIAYNVPLHYY
ncbi:hypothetical protein ARNL5_01172 [Anaerolineae bacterium]|nr:hypothetical protein ARNL5_01172 [Anaerolineae bacterium]